MHSEVPYDGVAGSRGQRSNTIDEMAALLPARWPVDALVLYGSKARGEDTLESDIDLLVLTGRLLSTGRIERHAGRGAAHRPEARHLAGTVRANE